MALWPKIGLWVSEMVHVWKPPLSKKKVPPWPHRFVCWVHFGRAPNGVASAHVQHGDVLRIRFLPSPEESHRGGTWWRLPKGSMGLEVFKPKCRQIFQSHGAYGLEKKTSNILQKKVQYFPFWKLLLGGWTNPFEKLSVKLDHLPK